MRAVVIDTYVSADQLEVGELPVPQVGPGELRVRVRATSVNPIDWKLSSGSLRLIYRLRFPHVVGLDVAGTVDAVGEGVDFEEGERVYCRLEGMGGAVADFVVNPAEVFGRIPEGLSFEDAAAIPLAGMTALQALRDKGGVKPGDEVLVNGASGGVGSFAVQIAVALGARVTAVCSAKNHELVTSLGAEHTIDYHTTDFTRGEMRYAVVFDAVGNSSPWACRAVLRDQGTYITTVPKPGLLLGKLMGVFGGANAEFIKVRPVGADIDVLSGWVTEGKLEPVIDSTFELAEIGAAYAKSMSGRARGKIVIRM